MSKYHELKISHDDFEEIELALRCHRNRLEDLLDAILVSTPLSSAVAVDVAERLTRCRALIDFFAIAGDHWEDNNEGD